MFKQSPALQAAVFELRKDGAATQLVAGILEEMVSLFRAPDSIGPKFRLFPADVMPGIVRVCCSFQPD